MLSFPRRLLPLLALALAACDQQPRFTAAEPGEALSAGAASVRQYDHNAFSMPAANLAPSRRLDFAVGNSFFRNPWVVAPATTTHATASARSSTPTPARTAISRTAAATRRRPMPPAPPRCWCVCRCPTMRPRPS
jgi:hypothetical protein